MEPRGRYSRGYVPHIDAGEVPQFITWRLADALPVSVLAAWERELLGADNLVRRTELAQRIEAYCDQGHGSCVLKDPRAARAVQETLFENHDLRCRLHSWVVMPNHVHVLLTPIGIKLELLVKALKGASSHRVNRLIGGRGRLWQPGFFDRLIRTTDHMIGTRRYTEWNPVKAKLCPDPVLWPWSSASAEARSRLEICIQDAQMQAFRAEARGLCAD
jgi:REP element-mobilizing transposase RayT